MKSPDIFFIVCILLPLLNYGQSYSLDYPDTKEVDQIDNYHGFKIQDPFRWLEDTKSEATHQWMEQQEALLENFLNDSPERSYIEDQINEFRKTGTSYATPVKGGDHYFILSYPKDKKHGSVYQQKGTDGEREMLFDPNERFDDPDQTFGSFSVSTDGRYMVYQTSTTQSRWGELKVFDVEKRIQLKDWIQGTSSANMVWNAENTGFYYTSYGQLETLRADDPKLQAKIRFHRCGSSEEDPVIFSMPEKPNAIFRLGSSSSRKHLVISVFDGRSDRNDTFIYSMESTTPPEKFFAGSEALYNYIGNEGEDFYFYSNLDAPGGQVIQLNIKTGKQKVVIPEQDLTLAGGSSQGGNAMNLIGKHLVLLYRDGTVPFIRIYNLKGQLKHNLQLETGYIGSGIVGQPTGKEAWFRINTFLAPSMVYRLDIETGKYESFYDRPLPIKQSDYVTKSVLYTSKDGTKVPLFIAHKKGMKLDGSNPVFMYGYGFGGWVAVPWYQPQMLTWLEMGGIYVLPGIRGGGEYGEAWREAGLRHNRQNAIDDYIAAAEWLVEEKYTSAGQVVANGWSASGSLAAAAVIQRPDLFGAAMIGIPSLDMLRYQHFTAFKGWTNSYGSSENPEDFHHLYQWSPYHQIKAQQCYPPILVTCGEKDSVTPPQHSYKFIAAMQKHGNCQQPALLKIVRGAGHSFGTTSEQSLQTYTDELTFLMKVLDLNIKHDVKGQSR